MKCTQFEHRSSTNRSIEFRYKEISAVGDGRRPKGKHNFVLSIFLEIYLLSMVNNFFLVALVLFQIFRIFSVDIYFLSLLCVNLVKEYKYFRYCLHVYLYV